jgi:uncharacterized protein YjbJ (UPF0337 family)
MSDAKRDRAEGRWEETKGRVKEAVGDATDDERMEREGEADRLRGHGKQAKGHVKDAAGKAREAVRDVTNER